MKKTLRYAGVVTSSELKEAGFTVLAVKDNYIDIIVPLTFYVPKWLTISLNSGETIASLPVCEHDYANRTALLGPVRAIAYTLGEGHGNPRPILHGTYNQE